MMTIKQFASLCGCNTQTLRYYDKINLLKPIHVDPWSGYRYYAKSQAIDFVKIKNLQAADFTILEIKELIKKTDTQVYEAFDRKIAEQTQRLERIIEIQNSYLTEKNKMEKLVQNLSDYLLHALKDFHVLQEFGISPEEGPNIIAKLKTYIEDRTFQHLPAQPDVHMIIDNKIIRGADHVADALAALKGTDYSETVLLGDENIRDEDVFSQENSETIWEHHGWNFVYEFLDDIPEMEKGYDYCFFFKLTEEKYSEGLEFPLFMIATMIPKAQDDLIMGCCVERSTDAENHFALVRKM